MLSVSVHKDIGEYTEKVVGKLSARTLVWRLRRWRTSASASPWTP